MTMTCISLPCTKLNWRIRRSLARPSLLKRVSQVRFRASFTKAVRLQALLPRVTWCQAVVRILGRRLTLTPHWPIPVLPANLDIGRLGRPRTPFPLWCEILLVLVYAVSTCSTTSPSVHVEYSRSSGRQSCGRSGRRVDRLREKRDSVIQASISSEQLEATHNPIDPKSRLQAPLVRPPGERLGVGKSSNVVLPFAPPSPCALRRAVRGQEQTAGNWQDATLVVAGVSTGALSSPELSRTDRFEIGIVEEILRP